MKNIIKNIDKILKEDESKDKLSPKQKEILKKKKEAINNDKTIEK